LAALEPGIYPGIPFPEYLAWDAVDASLLKAMSHAPAMAHYRRTHPEHDKPAYLLGRLFHLLATNPESADSEFIVRPKTYTDGKGNEKPWHGGANVCKGWAADKRASGLEVVSQDDYERATGMATSVRTHPKLGPLVDRAQVEVSVVWRDSGTGVLCKGRWDLRKGGVLCDLKSTSSTAAPSPTAPWFTRAIRFGYDVQVAMYIDALIAIDPPSEVPWFVFGVVESYPPYLCADYDVHDDRDAESYEWLQYGRAHYRTLLDQYKWCVEHDKWEAYDTHSEMLLPPWVNKELYGL